MTKAEFYMLYYFSMDYPRWRRRLAAISDREGPEIDELVEKMLLVEQACREADPELYPWIIKGVTEGYTYQNLKSRYGLPCGVNRFGRIRTKYYLRLRELIQISRKNKVGESDTP
jgi:hypothetical protein